MNRPNALLLFWPCVLVGALSIMPWDPTEARAEERAPIFDVEESDWRDSFDARFVEPSEVTREEIARDQSTPKEGLRVAPQLAPSAELEIYTPLTDGTLVAQGAP